MDRVRDAPLYARVLFGLVAGLAIGLLVFALLSPARKEAIKMAAGCWPPALEGQRPDENFEKTPDPHKIWEPPRGSPNMSRGRGIRTPS